MPLFDSKRGFAGLRKAYLTPENSPPSTPKTEDVEAEADPEVIRRMSVVEDSLMEFLRRNGGLDEGEGEDDDDDDDAPPVASEKETSAFSSNPPEITHQRHAFPCADTFRELPSSPEAWPQAPIMVRPTPNTSTKIRGIRKAGSRTYRHFQGFCAGCILPINAGTEKPGESLVVDFESPHFIGTLLMRFQQAPASDLVEHSADETESYFYKKKRRFQAIVKGRFKTALPMSECVTGQSFSRPAGKLPARWIVASFVKFVSTLAPQLEATIDGDKPRFLTPLVATAHTVLCKEISEHTNESQDDYDYDATDLEGGVEEPPSTDQASVLANLPDVPDTTKSSVPARMKARKKAHNAMAAAKDATPFLPNREYTFEFYQHLLDFGPQGLAVDMGRPIGRVPLASALNGQPLKFMSAHRDPVTSELDSLWSFDIWHSSLYETAARTGGR